MYLLELPLQYLPLVTLSCFSFPLSFEVTAKLPLYHVSRSWTPQLERVCMGTILLTEYELKLNQTSKGYWYRKEVLRGLMLTPRPTWTYFEFSGDVEVRIGTKEKEEEPITLCSSRSFWGANGSRLSGFRGRQPGVIPLPHQPWDAQWSGFSGSNLGTSL